MFSTICAMTSYSIHAGTMIASGCCGRCSRSSWVSGRYASRRLMVNARQLSRTQYQTSMNRSSRLEIRISTATAAAVVSRAA